MTVTINGATGIAGVNGSATLPAVQGDDTNTGVFYPAADTVAITTGGTEAMRINSSGQVGIGTTNPTAPLDVKVGTGNFTVGLQGTANTQLTATGVLRFDTTAGTTVFTQNTTESMRIDASGNVGIGETNPTRKLDVVGTASATYFMMTSNTASAPAVDAAITRPANGTLAFITNSAEQMRIASTGVVTITNLAGTGSRAVNASAAGVLSAASDSRLKQEVTTATIPGLSEVMLLEPKAYKWLDDIEKRGDEAAVEIGFFANDVKDIIPSAAPMGNDGYYGFYDRAVTASLVKAIQEQQAMITALTARITALEVTP